MNLRNTPRKTLIACGLSILAPLAAAAIAQTARARASGMVRDIGDAVVQVESHTIELTQRAARMPDRSAIAQQLTRLQQQRADSAEPALVIAELTAACRAGGASVEAIRPLDRTTTAAPVARGVPPRYQIVVRGDYVTMARVMDGVSRRRLPVRVIGFLIAPHEKSSADSLRGEITVEAYVPRRAGSEAP